MTLEPLFAPRSLAVLGASLGAGKLGAVMARQLASFDGPVGLVNSRTPDAARGLYPSVTAVAEATGAVPDLVVACLPAPVTLAALAEAVRAGSRAAVVCAGGFAETGAEGRAAQQELAALAADTGLRILGPNTSGFVVPGRPLVASFVGGAERITPGTVGVVAASGGVNHALAFALSSAGVGVELAVGVGNAVDVSAADVVAYLAGSPTVTCIALHVETVPDGPALLAAVRAASARVPVVALVVGRADVGEFAQSHTGALATAWRTTRSALRQAGAVLVDDERGLVDAVHALSLVRLAPPGREPVAHTANGSAPPPPPAVGRVGLVTGQAGPGLLLADGLRTREVQVPPLQPPTVDRLGELLPPLTFQRNPVDTGRPSDTFGEVVRTVAGDPGIDVVAVYGLLEPDVVDLAGCLAALAGGPTPLVAVIGGLAGDVAAARTVLHAAGVPALDSPASAVNALCAVRDDAAARLRTSLSPGAAAESAPVLLDGPVDERALKELLARHGVAVPAGVVCRDHEAARVALGLVGGPVVVKVHEPVLAHKTDAGGVHLGVRTGEDMDRAVTALQRMGATSYLVEAQVPGPLELLVGAHRDPVFGPVVVLGLGGVAAEVIADVALRTAPVDPATVEDMIAELTLAPMLHGFRGGPRVDVGALTRVLDVVGRVLLDNPHVESFEINPVRVTAEGALVALDASLAPTTSTHERTTTP